ncbi:MAG TPA: ComEC/Rec2 family competence protein [Bacteroidia bacterium]|nr:ComEC/Rec2 family competence protein [Bacteroidia bacterium]
MNSILPRIPLVRLFIPFAAGIIVSYFSGIILPLYIFITGIILCTLFFSLQRKLLRHSLSWLGFDGIPIAIALFFSGMMITGFRLEGPAPQTMVPRDEPVALRIRLTEDPAIRPRSVKLFVLAESWKKNEWVASGERLLFYMERGPAEKLLFGDVLLLRTRIRETEGPGNPGEFDYKSWLERRNIYAQGWGKNGEWKKISENEGNFFKAMALDLRRYFLNVLTEYGITGKEGSVAAALLLGGSAHLDPGLLQAYSASGTLHVLSVSGMHVALIYLVLIRLLAPLEKLKYGKWLSIWIQLLFLWFYATITGLCPSVLRSVTMLTVVIAGNAFGKKAHVLNALAASAFILLLFDPLMLFDIGFQLSYLAVAGIVICQPKLEEWWQPSTWIGRNLWALVSVTLVAQVFTFPLCLYYFRQFPTYFLLSNLIVIPVSTLAIYIGISLLLLAQVVLIAKPLAVLFHSLISFLNFTVTEIEGLPFAVLRTAEWTIMEVLLLFTCIFLLLYFLFQRKPVFLRTALIGVLLLQVLVFTRNNRMKRETELVIFDVPNASAIGLISWGNNFLMADSLLAAKPGDLEFHVHPFFERHGIYTRQLDLFGAEMPPPWYRENRIQSGGKIIFIAGNGHLKLPGHSCDILLLKNNCSFPLDSLTHRLKPSLVVADGSDSYRKTAKWKKICAAAGIAFYDVKEKGALVIKAAN